MLPPLHEVAGAFIPRPFDASCRLPSVNLCLHPPTLAQRRGVAEDG